MENLDFFLMSPEEIIQQSVCHVTNTSIFRYDNPCPNGLMDTRMGTTDRRYRCATCKRGQSCPGHFGHISFGGQMFYHPGHLGSLVNILRCVCPFCSRLLLLPGDVRLSCVKSGKKKLSYYSSICKTVKKCPYDDCGIHQPSKIQKTEIRIFSTWNSATEEFFDDAEEWNMAKASYNSASNVYRILKHIPWDHLRLLGFLPEKSHPKNTVISVLAVPPVQIRPSIMASDCSKMRGHDDLTTKLLDILRNNVLMKGAILDGDDKKRAEYADLIQQHLLVYLHHDSKGIITRNLKRRTNGSRGKERNISERLKGKKGRVRGNCSGKRVNQCARAVVSPDPTHNIWQLGVPRGVANVLTKPVMVNSRNRKSLHDAVCVGKQASGGAATVETVCGTTYDLSTLTLAEREDMCLDNGMIVHRHLRDGDWVLFNRQPTLHRSSMMGHEVYVHDDLTFRLNLSCCTAYNADFDGDEMNLHAIQSEKGEAEIRSIMSVPANIIDPQNSKPIISLIMDSLLASYLITQRSVFFSRRQIMQLMMHVQFPRYHDGTVLPPPAIEVPEPLWTGKQILCLVIPDNICMVRRVRQCPKGSSPFDDRLVVVNGGELLNGTLSKETMKTSSGGLVHVINNDGGALLAAEFLSDCQRVFRQYLQWRGFSVGLGDCRTSEATTTAIRESLRRCKDVTDTVYRMPSLPLQLREHKTSGVVSGMLNKLGSVLQNDMADTNGFHAMLTSGSKGSTINISQISGSVGQQNVSGSRILPKSGKRRTLPCYANDDTKIENFGFIKNSYVTGITFPEFFFHAMGGREGLCHTAVKTATTGYIQRRMVKSLESLTVAPDRSVRNGDGHVVQFAYGGDGFNPCCIEKIPLPTFFLTDEELFDAFGVDHWSDEDWSAVGGAATEWRGIVAEQLRALSLDRDRMQSQQPYLLDADPKIYTIVNPHRVLTRASRKTFGALGSDALTPTTFADPWRWLMRRFGNDDGLDRVRSLLRAHCTVRQVVGEHGLSVQQWQWALDEMERYLVVGRIAPGEMVGSIAATSLGEPTTQLCLNTFHFSGIGEKNVTLGVPRITELINATVDIRTPNIRAYLTEEYEKNGEMAQQCANMVQSCKLGTVVRSNRVVWDPELWSTCVDEHRDMVDAHAAVYERTMSVTKWVICLLLDRNELVRRGLGVTFVKRALRRHLGENAQIVCAAENRLEWVVRVRLDTQLVGDNGGHDDAEHERRVVTEVRDYLLVKTQINGISTVESAFVKEYNLNRSKRLYLDVFGTDMLKFMALPFVDALRTYSNHIHEIQHTLGIEAAVFIMMQEIEKVLSFDGTYIDLHHIYLLVENCCSSGQILAMTRHGMAKRAQAPLVRASFEETTEVLFEASLFGSHDPVSGVSEAIMLGKRTKCGTGSTALVYDESIVPPLPETTHMFVEPLQQMSTKQLVEQSNVAMIDEEGEEDEPVVSPTSFVGRKRKHSVPESNMFVPNMLTGDTGTKPPSPCVLQFRILSPHLFRPDVQNK